MNNTYINKFIDYLKYEKKLSDNTVSSYYNDLKNLYNYNKKYYLFKEKDIYEYIEYLSYLDSNSINHNLSVLNSLYSFLEEENIIKDNPCKKIDRIKISKRLPKFLTEEEINKLLDIKLIKPNDYRNKAILELMYATGLRISELVNLKVSDISFDDCYIRVVGKGSKERIVPIADTALKYLKIYINEKRNYLLKKKDSEYVFISSYGTKITRQAIFKFIKMQAKDKNIKSEISPHTLRHSFASVLLKNGANIRVIQELLGHSDLQTTQIYTHLINEKIKKDYEEYHPRSKKI